MVELTDDQAKQVVKIVEAVRVKHMDGSTRTPEKLAALHKELEGRLQDAGYEVTVDVTPMYQGEPPSVRIDSAPDGKSDLERKLWDIAKRLERGEDAPNIEGLV